MTINDSLLLDPAQSNIWLAARNDGVSGSGTSSDPYDASTRKKPVLNIALTNVLKEATADTTPVVHPFVDGDVVTITGVTGLGLPDWNGTFGIYGVSRFTFNYYMKKTPADLAFGSPVAAGLTFPFDELMRKTPENIQIRLGPGVYQTRGFAPNDLRGWQPKSGQKIRGSGVDVTTLQLVGAENADQHYHVVGMLIEPTGTTSIPTLESVEISDLTIDCNLDNQPTRLNRYTSLAVSLLSRSGTIATAAISAGHGLQNGDFVTIKGASGTDASRWNGMFKIGNVLTGSFDYTMSDALAASPATGTITAVKVIPYPNVACGAVRIFGNHSKVSRVKAINWGTKSFKEGCFVISLFHSSGRPTDVAGEPVLTEKEHNGIEDCIAIEPSKNNARETTVLHLGGLKNQENQANAFGRAPFIRRNFVDCRFLTSFEPANASITPFSSSFITSKSGTTINPTTNVGTFVGRRLHYRNALDSTTFARFHNTRDPQSRWNGYAEFLVASDDELAVKLGPPIPNVTDNNDFIVMGTEFRAIAVTSAAAAVVEDNQIHNCWIGGPYSSPLDDSVSDPSSPPTLAREERLDPLNALSTRGLVVRNNFYKNVAAGPYWNMGGLSGSVAASGISYNTGIVTVTTPHNHKLWLHARIKISSAPHAAYNGVHAITEITDETTFKFALPIGLTGLGSGTASYQVVSGVDFLTIEGNIIELADLDEAEFAIKEYPLAANSAKQAYRAYGIVVADNELSSVAGPYAHRQVFIRNNKIRYVEGYKQSRVAGIGPAAGAAMQLTGIQQLHVVQNVLDVTPTPSQRTFRCGTVRFFHNVRPNGELRRGWKGDTDGFYDEPEAIMEDAFVLSMLNRRRR